MLKRIFYDNKNNISKILVWNRYNDGREKTCNFYNKNGKLISQALNMYNEKKVLIKTEWYENKDK